ncbi:DUF6959 family protein [Nocardia caishijiensis]|uniref:Uncharacterized protein n=1 Tax=Nocardia caishijiensis TaxID=184756 RepID=A0ABQ6YGX8_9NOCA|nr:hypothetical protein [Nocardia caishijiensis]KAF0845047.1 hypothetical protein FNL39_10975 [Nocardia caishijiensis]
MDNSAELLETEGDYSLIRWFGRKFPGVLIQGDTLSILIDILAEARELLNAGDSEETKFVLGDLAERLGTVQSSYETMMKKAGIELPY